MHLIQANPVADNLIKHDIARDRSRQPLSSIPTLHFRRYAEVFGEGQPAVSLYRLISGSVREFRILNDGRRQITRFVFPGDIFGLHVEGRRLTSAETIDDCRVTVLSPNAAMEGRTGLSRPGEVSPAFLALGLQQIQDHLMLLVQSADERVAHFLLEMEAHCCEDSVLTLPMTRQDIADYLGLTIETVSRTFSQFERNGWIDMSGSRKIRIQKRLPLVRLNS